MGFVTCMSPCIVCHQVFSYNPHRVPSTSVVTGTREPVCRDCMNRINERRKEKGLAPFPILSDAYEPLDEREL